MPILCVDGEITDLEMVSWNILPLRTSVALTCDEVRAAFVGKPLARGVALLRFNRAQLARLFPGRSQRKAAYQYPLRQPRRAAPADGAQGGGGISTYPKEGSIWSSRRRARVFAQSRGDSSSTRGRGQIGSSRHRHRMYSQGSMP